MICPICNQKFSYLKISTPIIPREPADPNGVFHCPKCDGRLKLSFRPVFEYGSKQVGDILGAIFSIILYLIIRSFSPSYGPVFLMFLSFVAFVYVMLTYVQKFATPVEFKENQNIQKSGESETVNSGLSKSGRMLVKIAFILILILSILNFIIKVRKIYQ